MGLPFLVGTTILPGTLGRDEQIICFMSVFAGILLCKAAYEVTARISSQFKFYLKLNKVQKVEWNNRGFSTVHAVLVAAVAFYLVWLSDLFQSDSTDKLMINSKSTLSNSILAVSIGYFLTDLGMIIWYFPALGGKEYIAHHVISMYSIFLALIVGRAQIYILMVLFTEITTPLVNLRWYLDVAGLKTSTIYVVNGIALFLGWLVARILVFIYFYGHMYHHFDQVKTIFPLGFYSLLIAPATLALMNLFWFWKILKGLIKTVSRKKQRD